MDKSTRIIYMGTPEFAVYPLKRLTEEGYNVCAVVTVPDKAKGRGLQLSSSKVKEYAQSIGIPILQPESLKDESFIAELKAIDPHIMVVVAFRMLPKVVWSLPSIGTFNLHASLLPQYRGAAPINWAIINGETTTGVTTFMLDEEIDTGAIIKQTSVHISPNDNAGSLHDKLRDIGSELVVDTVASLISGDYSITPQPQEANKTDLKPAPKLNKENTKIDWSKDCSTIQNLVRGLSPYPCAHSVIIGEKGETPVKIFDVSSNIATHNHQPGTIISDGRRELKVACNNGYIIINELQSAGKKRLKIKEFLAGFREPESYSFA